MASYKVLMSSTNLIPDTRRSSKRTCVAKLRKLQH